MRRKRITAASLLAAALLALPLVAAQTPRMTVTPKKATVGDPIQVRLTVPGAKPGEIGWPQVGPQLGGFTVLSADTAKGKERKRFGGPTITWTVAAYDTGTFATGDLDLRLPTGQVTVPGDSVSIVTVLTDSTGSQFRPLKAQMDLPITFMDVLRWTAPWILGALALVLIFLLVRRLLRRRRRILSGEVPEAPPIPPYDEAVAALARLKRDNPLRRGDLKGYVSSLSQIVKRLIGRVHGSPVTDMTTWEVRRWLRDHRILCEPSEVLHLLEAADGVKFAKMVLDGPACDDLYASAERMVVAYKPHPEPAESGDGSQAKAGAAVQESKQDETANGEAERETVDETREERP